MNQQKNILARFKKNATHSSPSFFDGSYSSFLKQWVLIIVFGLVATAGVVWWSAERFNYWSNLEERAAKEEVTGTFYDQKAVRVILDDYESRAERSESILNNLEVIKTEEVLSEDTEEGQSNTDEEILIDVSTSTATSTSDDSVQ